MAHQRDEPVMSLHQPLWMAAGAQQIAVDAADFDGATNVSRGAALTGVADSKMGILSCWLRSDSLVGTRSILWNDSQTVIIDTDTTAIIVTTRTAALTSACVLTANTAISTGTWYHVLASWDVATAGARALYVNDVDDMHVTAFVNNTIAYATGVTDWYVGHTSGVFDFDGCLAELYFAPGQYLDFSTVSNRRKFISANGKPVYLGADGSIPTGTAPAIYMHLDDGEAAANFDNNLGSGGTFTTTAGTLTTCASSPSG